MTITTISIIWTIGDSEIQREQNTHCSTLQNTSISVLAYTMQTHCNHKMVLVPRTVHLTLQLSSTKMGSVLEL